MKTKYAQLVKDLKSAKEFCEVNKITPEEIIITWYEGDLENENKRT